MSLLKKVALGSGALGALGVLGYGIKKFLDSREEKKFREQRFQREAGVEEYKRSERSKTWEEFLQSYGIECETFHSGPCGCMPFMNPKLYMIENLQSKLEKTLEALAKVQNAPKIALNEELVLNLGKVNFPRVFKRSKKYEVLEELDKMLSNKLEKLNEILSTKSDFSSFDEEEKGIYRSFADLGEKIKLCFDTQTLFFTNLEQADLLLRKVKNAPKLEFDSWIFTATATKPLDELNEILNEKLEKLKELAIKKVNLNLDEAEKITKKADLTLGDIKDDTLNFNDLDEAEKALIQSFAEFKEKLEPYFNPGVFGFFNILKNLEATSSALYKVQGAKEEFHFYCGNLFRAIVPFGLSVRFDEKIYTMSQNFTPSQENDLKEFDEMLSKKLEKLKALVAEKTYFSDFDEEEKKFYQSFREIDDRIKFLTVKNKIESAKNDTSKA